MPRPGTWPISTGFSACLRSAREEAGLSRRELAAMTFVHEQTIVKLEAGRQEPGWPLVLLIARALGKDVNYFVPIESAMDLMDAPTEVR